MTLLQKSAWLVSPREYENLLQEHWEKVSSIHFDKNGGTPYWLNKAHERGVDLSTFRTLQDFLDNPFSLCNENDLKEKPISYFIPQFAGPFKIYLSSGSTGKKKEAHWSEAGMNYVSDYASYMFDKSGIPRSIDWIVQGPAGIWQDTVYRVVDKRNGLVHPAYIESRGIKRHFTEIKSPEDFGKSAALQVILGPATEFTADTLAKEKIGGIATAIHVLPSLTGLPGFENVRAIYLSGMEIPKEQYEEWRRRLPHVKFISSFGHHQLGFSYNPPSQYETYYSPFPLSLVFVVDEKDPHKLVEYGKRGRHKILRMDDAFLWCQLDRDFSERVPPQDELKWDGIKDVQPSFEEKR